MNERTIAATVHGRYLAIPPAMPGPAPILVGFHGYAENAEIQLDRLKAIPGSDRWLIVSIQALHPFYRRPASLVVASWMTRQGREMAIAENIVYVSACIDAVTAEWPALPTVVFAGFSQGVAMAFRAAASSTGGVVGVIAAGGDIPPEIDPVALQKVSKVIIARGKSDELYAVEQFAKDEQRLRQCSVSVHAIHFSGGHEWPGDFDNTNSEAAQFLQALYP